MDLSETERGILELEGQRWKYPGAKEAQARAVLGLSSTRYYQLLHHLIERPGIEAVDPLLVGRLRRLRDRRRAQRTGRPPVV